MPSHKQVERYLVFAFGVLFIIVMLGLAIWRGEPTPFQWFVFRVVLALAAAGVAAFVPGFLDVAIKPYIRASGAIAVFVLVYMFTPASLVTDRPNLGTEEQTALELKDDVLILRGTWETSTPNSKAKVSTAAPLLAEAILRLDDSKLRLGYQLVKYQYATYAYVLACESESEALARNYCQAAITQGTKYLELIDEAASLATDSPYNIKIAKWARESRQIDRAGLLLAEAHALLFRITGDVNQAALARQYYDALSRLHKEEYPLRYNKILQPVLGQTDSINDAVQQVDRSD